MDSRNWLTMMACTGIIIVDSRSRNSALRPRNCSLAKAKPASRLHHDGDDRDRDADDEGVAEPAPDREAA